MTDCKLASHESCKDRLSQLCIPTDTTPTKGTQGNMISDFAPLDPPYVPGIILQCVNEVCLRIWTGFYPFFYIVNFSGARDYMIID